MHLNFVTQIFKESKVYPSSQCVRWTSTMSTMLQSVLDVLCACMYWIGIFKWVTMTLNHTAGRVEPTPSLFRRSAPVGTCWDFKLPNITLDLTSLEWEWGEWPGQRGWWRPHTEALPVAAAATEDKDRKSTDCLIHRSFALLFKMCMKKALW